MNIIGTTDKFTLTNWYLGNQYHVEQFKTSDDKVLLDSAVQNLVQAKLVQTWAPRVATTRLSKLSSGMAARWCGVPRVHFLMQAMQARANSMDNNEDDFERETVLLGSVNLLSGNRLHVGAEWHQ